MLLDSPPAILRLRGLAGLILLAGLFAAAPRLAVADGAATGEAIYRDKCATCHGAMGEGTKEDYPYPLAGDRALPELAKLIAKTMPADDPGACKGEEAEKVAAYVYENFYSKTAQARNQPARIELARLTVRQYQNAVADLIGSFREAGTWGDRRGLRGQYFNSRGFRDDRRVIDRTDPEVRFDFGTLGPDREAFDPHQFAISWEGSVLAPDTGDYEFLVRTDHATRLWVNDLKRPLIDGLVKSGNDAERRATIRLLGGRAYPIKLEFSKAKQGVDDSKKTKELPPLPASIELAWKPPRHVAETIPARYLTPGKFPRTFVVETAFPPDDRSMGYERATTISKAWEQATTQAAIEVAGHVVANLPDLTGVRGADADRDKKYREFCRKLAERAFRRPLTDEQKRAFIDRQFEKAGDSDLAVKRVVLLVLKSPRFLYREVGGDGPDAYDVASRLAFGMWDSAPDAPLLEAAAAGALANREQVMRQAERMAGDLRARAKLRDFFLQWLKVDQPAELSKDRTRYPDFDDAVASDLRTSLELFLDDVVWGEASDFRQLFLSDALFLNGRLGWMYGAVLDPYATFQKVAPGAGERAGVLTHPYLLSCFAYTSTSSPIHRGVFVARNVLGRTLRPPPEAFTPVPAELHPQLTTRERVAMQTQPDACIKCHGMINPLGFTLEHFDAVGRYRKEEGGRPVDATGTYQTRTGETVTFSGVRDLAAYLAGSEEVHGAFVERLFHYLVKQPIRAYGPKTLADLRQSFASGDFHIRKLMVEIVATSALTTERAKVH